MKISEKSFQLLLYSYLIDRPYNFINTYFFGNESDFLSFTTAGYLYEYEIKISRSDFFVDFKKPRFKTLSKVFSGANGANLRSEKKIANRFYYVVPEGLIKLSECPDFAGLICINGNKVTEVKKAPLIHRTMHDKNLLYNKIYHVYNWYTIDKLKKRDDLLQTVPTEEKW